MTDRTAKWLNPGFTRDSVVNYLFKNALNRADTSMNNAIFQEQFGGINLFLRYLATDLIPEDPPTDFVKLTEAEIAAVFGIQEDEVREFDTRVGDALMFSVERSAAYPFILRINNLLMKPHPKNPSSTFVGVSSKSKVNVIAPVIGNSYGNGQYKTVVKRTGASGELSAGGNDFLNVHQVAHIFDSDDGILTLHEPDKPKLTTNPISFSNPPALSCFVYHGNFGRLGWHVQNNAIVLDETQLLLGKKTITDPSLIMDVSGAAFIEELTTTSVSTFSDARLKENIVPAPINKHILELQPVHYNYKTKPGTKEYGIIAQEVQKVAPEIVGELGDHLSVQYDRIGLHLLPIIKEQEARIAHLEAQLQTVLKILERASN
jgi:hypothetical protein